MDYIKEELSAQGHTVRDAHNAIGHRSKNPLPLFFINLEPAPNNKEAFNIKRLCKSVVTVEPPLKFNDIPQCYRCQGYGHSQRYCKLQVRCVKCGEEHATSECQKKREDPAKCVHCGGAHPASYKGCPAYKKAKTVLSPSFTHRSTVTGNQSYADTIKGATFAQQPKEQSQAEDKSQEDQMTAILTRMENMFEKMMDKMFKQMTVMITSILAKVCK